MTFKKIYSFSSFPHLRTFFNIHSTNNIFYFHFCQFQFLRQQNWETLELFFASFQQKTNNYFLSLNFSFFDSWLFLSENLSVYFHSYVCNILLPSFLPFFLRFILSFFLSLFRLFVRSFSISFCVFLRQNIISVLNCQCSSTSLKSEFKNLFLFYFFSSISFLSVY